MNTAISIKNLYKKFGENEILKDINLDINQGKIIGYIGPNGAGKSTTLKILAGIITDYSGEVNVLGIDLRKDPVAAKRRIGFVPENALLYDVLTPMEYLNFIGELHRLPKHEINRKARDLLHIFGLSSVENKRMVTFSKGMRQKILLIAGLIHNPELILFDEPLSGLDTNTVILLKEIMVQLKNQGKTIIYSSHLMDIVEKISDQIILIVQGTVIANGSFGELKATQNESLEQIFTQLTGNNNIKITDMAELFIDALK